MGRKGRALQRPFLSNTRSIRIHPQAPFIRSYCKFRAFRKGRPFRGNYRLVFDDKSLKYVTPENMPDEIKPACINN